MITQLDTENADRDITSYVTCLTHTPDASNPVLCQAIVYLGDGTKDLDGTGGSFSIRVRLASQYGATKTEVISAVGRAFLQTDKFSVPANVEVKIDILSPNGADTDVDVTAYLMDVGVSEESVNAECDTALTDYDPPTKTEMDNGFAALNDISPAEVNTECDTALADYDPPTNTEMLAAHSVTDALINALSLAVAGILNIYGVDE